MVRIRAIGTAEVQLGRTRITPASEVLFAFVLYFALNAGQRIPRAQVLDLFWLGLDDRSRRHALRQLLYRLRRLGLALAEEGDMLRLDRAHADSDVLAILEPDWPDTASEDSVIAAAQVLPGYAPPMPAPYREWLDSLRARLNAQFRRAALRHIERARAEGRWAHVDAWAERCLAADPLNEEATLARAEALMMQGSKARAQAVLDDYLWELGDRHRVIGLPAKLLRRRISDVRSSEPARAESVPLVGRADAVACLNAALSSTLSGGSAAVLVAGAPGIGKSALARELLSSAALRGWRSAVVRLQPSDQHRPLAVFVDLFAEMLRMPGALGSEPQSLAQLQRLTEHAVRDEEAAPGRSQEAEAVQDRIRASALDLLGAVCDDGPIVLLLEDLHWIDDESIQLLQHLLARSRALPLLWLLTARPEARYPTVREALAGELVRLLTLERLSPADAATLYRALANAPALDDAGVRDLADRVAGGNPLFVREIARHVGATGHANSLPQSLRALIRDRVDRLQANARHVLHTCAVLGRYATVPRVARVLEIGTAGLLAFIDELVALGILGGGEGVAAVGLHDLWQEELLSSLAPASRQLIHHRCGVVLEGESRETRSATMVWEAARHFEASGAHRRALKMLEECAQHLLANGMPVEAAETFEVAFAAAASDEEKFRTLCGRIRALHGAGYWTQMAPLVEQADSFSDTGGSGRHSDLELLRTEILWRTEVDPESSLEHAMMCTFDSAAPPAHRARAAVIAARTASHLARYADLARVHAGTASLHCSGLEDKARLLSVATIYHTELGSLETAGESALRLIAIERELGSVSGLALALRFAIHPFRYLGQSGRVMELAHEALDIAERHHMFADAGYTCDVLFALSLEREDLGAARAWLDSAEHFAKQSGAPYVRDSLNIGKAVLALAVGDLKEAEDLIGMDVVRHARVPTVRPRLLKLSVLIRLLTTKGSHEGLADAVTLVRQGLDLAGMTGRCDYIAASYAIGVSALGDTAEARSYVRKYLAGIRRERTSPGRELLVHLDVLNSDC